MKRRGVLKNETWSHFFSSSSSSSSSSSTSSSSFLLLLRSSMAPSNQLSRSSFPSSFIFGLATSSIQIEGAASLGGRGPGIWDTFSSVPGKIADGSSPAVACDHFHRYQEDILEMKKLGVDAYRFSISWPRLFPDNSGKLNEEGVAFYNALINFVVETGLIPFVTLYHWDLPQYLQDDPDVKGWATKNIVQHFVKFATACFKCFGDRVKHWITFNEIHLTSVFAYGLGLMAPGGSGNKSREPYLVAHHQLLSHAASVKIYRQDYKEVQNGKIGLTANVGYYEPLTESQEDKDAAARFQEFETGWILDPIVVGNYPAIMREMVGDRLPRFSDEETEDLRGSADFIGVNYYTASWASKAKSGQNLREEDKWWINDGEADESWEDGDGKLIGEMMGPPGIPWFRNCAWGLRKALAWIDKRYGKIPLYITENGTLDKVVDATVEEAMNDLHRINFLTAHLEQASHSVMHDHVNLQGFFIWTYMDNWEWMNGFRIRFGLYYVDFHHAHLPRYPKASAKWLAMFLAN